MADAPTGAMVALVPADSDTERLAMDSGEPASVLHCTLMYLGAAADFTGADRTQVIDAVRAAFTDRAPVDADGFSIAVFNPGDADPDRESCIVLGLGGDTLEPAMQAARDAVDALNLEAVPQQRTPWHPHVTLIYTDDLGLIETAVDRVGPLTFDRVRVAFASEVTDIPLNPQADGASQARATRMGGALNPFLKNPAAYQRTPLRAERPSPKTGDNGVVALRLYDPLDSWGGDWGVSAKEFVTTLDELPRDTTEIRLLINSPGGEVWEGLAVLNALRAHPARVVAVVEGIAASSASFIAAGADELIVMENAELFVHCAWGGCIGNAADMAKMAADLEHEDRNLASIYARKAGGTVEDWLAVMAGETFYSAEEAVAAGLADRVAKPDGDEDAVSKAKARFDLSVFAKGRHAAQNPTAAPSAEPTTAEPSDDGVHDLPAAEPEPTTEPKEDPVSTLSETLRSRLGLADDADETAALAAIDALKAKADATQPDPDPEPQPDPELVALNGQLVEKVTVLTEQVQAMSTELAATKAEKAATAKAAVFDAAIRDGKIKPADRASWEARYDKAPDVITDVLASIASGTAVPVNVTGETGTSGPEFDNDADWDAALARLDGPTATKGA